MADQLISRIESLIASQKTPGIGALIIDKTDQKVLDIARGPNSLTDPSKGQFTNDTPFYIQSCTKLLTCLCLLQLLEQGKLSIDDPVSKYLPRQSEWKVATVDEDGTAHFRPPSREVTFRHLFTHTSGMTYDFFSGDENIHRYRTAKGQPTFTMGTQSQEWHYYDAFLDFDPGENFHYGMSIDHLGFVLEAITGLRLDEYMKKYIFDPLGMSKTGPEFVTDEFLRMHATLPDGSVIALEDARMASRETAWRLGGGHFLVSTMNDYSKVLVALLNGGTHPSGVQVLKPETVKEYVFKDCLPGAARQNVKESLGTVRQTIAPGVGVDGDVGQIFAATDERGWSCTGLLNLDDAPGGRKAGSVAWAGLCNTYYWIDPTAGLAGIITTNKLPFAEKDFMDLFVQFEKAAYSSKSNGKT